MNRPSAISTCPTRGLALGTGIALAALGVVAFAGAFTISPSGDGDGGPRAFPLAAAAVLAVLGSVHAYGAWRRAGASEDGDAEEANGAADGRGTERELGHGHGQGHGPGHATRSARLALLVIACALYAFLFGRVGYLASTALAAPALLALFGVRSPLALAAVAVLAPLGYHLVFFELLDVFPPYGQWFDLSLPWT